MKFRQIIVSAAIGVAALMAIFPPWIFKYHGFVRDRGYAFLFTLRGYREVDFATLFTQWCVVALLAGVVICCVKDREVVFPARPRKRIEPSAHDLGSTTDLRPSEPDPFLANLSDKNPELAKKLQGVFGAIDRNNRSKQPLGEPTKEIPDPTKDSNGEGKKTRSSGVAGWFGPFIWILVAALFVVGLVGSSNFAYLLGGAIATLSLALLSVYTLDRALKRFGLTIDFHYEYTLPCASLCILFLAIIHHQSAMVTIGIASLIAFFFTFLIFLASVFSGRNSRTPDDRHKSHDQHP